MMNVRIEPPMRSSDWNELRGNMTLTKTVKWHTKLLTMITLLMLLVSSVSLATAPIKPTDGLWGTYDNPDVGSGLLMMTQGRVTVISIMTYQENGQPIWYLATGEVDSNGQLVATLYQTTGGQYLTTDQPPSASFNDQTRQLVLNFAGDNQATFSIDGTVERIIRPANFGFGDDVGLPDLTGQWLLADPQNEAAMVLDLQRQPAAPVPISPFRYVPYESVHHDTAGWVVNCYVLLVVQIDFQCDMQNPATNDIWYLSDLDVSTQQMLVRTSDLAAEPVMQAFRLDSDQRLKPNDGYWRPQDDPAIGSGVLLHTQGSQTVVLVYSYADSGEPIWQIAAGSFDEEGLLQADLFTATGGTPLSQPDPTSATFNATTLDLSIQLLGTELATLSIAGSTPKFIQNLNHSIPLFETEQLFLNEQPFRFPLLTGQWVMVDAQQQNAAVVDLIEISGLVSPQPPTVPLIYENLSDQSDNPLNMRLFCHRQLDGDQVIGHCDGSGSFQSQTEVDQFRSYYQDLGHNRFRVYYGADQAGINRSSPYHDFFRLADFD